MKLLGVKIGDHDTSVSLSIDGVVHYHKSERAFQSKHLGFTDTLYWVSVINDWGVTVEDLDAVCVVMDPELTTVQFDPTHISQPMPNDVFGGMVKCPIYRLDHHAAHAYSAWPVINLDDAPIRLVFDGDGDFNRSYTVFDGERVIQTDTTDRVESFGKVLEDLARLNAIKGHFLDLAGKAMGLKSYGTINDVYVSLIDGMTLDQINTVFQPAMWCAVTEDSPPIDFLATVHAWAERAFPAFFEQFVDDRPFIFSGGVAQSSVLNGVLQKRFPQMVIPPHCTDDGLSLGCVEWLRRHLQQPALTCPGFPFIQDDVDVGYASTDTVNTVADMLAAGRIVGWMQGVGEVGPRALGHRSILMSPLVSNGKEVLNQRVKHREWYRPFGCSVIKGRQQEFFDVSYDSPYMLHVALMKHPTKFPSITHVDGTVRFQTVDEQDSFFSLLNAFNNITGCPILLNTSLNVNMKPIASSPADAFAVFGCSDMDALVIGNTIHTK